MVFIDVVHILGGGMMHPADDGVGHLQPCLYMLRQKRQQASAQYECSDCHDIYSFLMLRTKLKKKTHIVSLCLFYNFVPKFRRYYLWAVFLVWFQIHNVR